MDRDVKTQNQNDVETLEHHHLFSSTASFRI